MGKNKGLNMRRYQSMIGLFMVFSIFLSLIGPQRIYADPGQQTKVEGKVKVLHIVSGENSKKSVNLGPNVEATTMRMKRFVALREELNGKYDAIYIDNGNYSTQSVQGTNHNTKEVMNDITNLKAKQIKEEFIDKGQLVFLHEKIFNIQGEESKLKAHFGPYGTSRPANVIIVKGANKLKAELEKDSAKEIINRRPIIQSASVTNNTASGRNVITVDYKLEKSQDLDYEKMNLNAKLYLDANNNKAYEPTELYGIEKVKASEGSISYEMPKSYAGKRFVKFEIINEDNDLKDYKEEIIELVGETVKVKVLQVKNDYKDVGLNKLFKDKKLEGLLGGPGQDYHIEIDEIWMGINEESKKGKKGPFFNDMVSIPGQYNMVIFGFGDSYGFPHNASNYIEPKAQAIITNRAADMLLGYIKTGQSVMFTHDTMFSPTGKGKDNIWVNKFADITGQNKTLHNLGNGAPNQSKSTKKVNDGLLVQYPNPLGETIAIASTHNQYFELDLEDKAVVPWYNITGGNRDEDDSYNHYYTYSKGTVTYSGTGHTTSGYPDSELKLFVNTMYTAFFGANQAPVIENVKLQDKAVISEAATIQESKSLVELEYRVKDLNERDKYLNTKVSYRRSDSEQWKEVLNKDIANDPDQKIECIFTNPRPEGFVKLK